MNTASIKPETQETDPWQTTLPTVSDIIPGIFRKPHSRFEGCRARRLIHTALALALGSWAVCNGTVRAQTTDGITPAKPAAPATAAATGNAANTYTLPPLPYAYNALEPLMDEATLRLHHDKHHAAYVAGANKAAQKLREIAEGKLDAAQAPQWARTLSFNASGHALHTVYWTNMSPTPQTAPEGALEKAIVKEFGSVEGLMKVFRSVALGVEGSGWAVLGVDPSTKELVVCGVEKHQNYAIPGLVPILACDVWEHAYYLKHQNNRAAYIDNFLKLVDWKNVQQRYAATLGSK